MTDIPKAYLDEAVRRLNATGYVYSAAHHVVQVLARTLKELGWQPPVDPVEQRAWAIARSVYQHLSDREIKGTTAYQAALIALREGMGE